MRCHSPVLDDDQPRRTWYRSPNPDTVDRLYDPAVDYDQNITEPAQQYRDDIEQVRRDSTNDQD